MEPPSDAQDPAYLSSMGVSTPNSSRGVLESFKDARSPGATVASRVGIIHTGSVTPPSLVSTIDNRSMQLLSNALPEMTGMA